MKKIHYIIILINILFVLNSYGQCLCGKFRVQIPINDLSFKNDNSNYELIIIDKPKFFSFDSKILNKNHFSNDTLNLYFGTGSGIRKLKIQLKNRINLSTMQFTIFNMTYDNDYFIDLPKFISGDYVFDWAKINKCQSKSKTTKMVDCEGMRFIQLMLLSEKPMLGNFNHNKIKVTNLEYFLKKNKDSTQIKNRN